jgi:23S rRNA (adenine-N6)-dimethyltransferase
MAKTHKRIALAQNFLRSPKLVRALLEVSSIGRGDLVYEIGPGRGIIEKDAELVQSLCRRFQHLDSVRIVMGDFLHYRISSRQYKIFASIPYNLTAEIVRKILYLPPQPEEAYLIVQKEAAEKFAGCPRETQFSVLAKPLFDIQILQQLRRTDFEPVPKVDSVFLRIKRRQSALVRKEDVSLYRSFVRYGFGAWKSSLKQTFKPVFSYEQWKRLSKDLHFSLDAIPSHLTFEQWLGLFECFKQRVPGNKQASLK